MFNNKKLRLVVCFCTIFCFVCTNNFSYAQGESPGTSTKKYQIDESTFEDEEDGTGETSADVSPEEDEHLLRMKQNPAYEVLGRKLSEQEKDIYGKLSAKEIKEQLLHREQKLVLVRAAVATGASEDLEEILGLYDTTKLRTFTELVREFQGYIEKYGSLKEGLRAELVLKIDDEQAFRQAALRAYYSVFGIKSSEIEAISKFLKAHDAITYSKMIETLARTLTPDDKKEMLFRALEQIGRPDLKQRKDFTEKLLSQNFTYETLLKLLKQIPAGQAPPSRPKQK